MRFTIGRELVEIDPAQVPRAIRGQNFGPVLVHWVEVEGSRMPAKPALRAVLGRGDLPFNAHQAVRVFRKLGYATSNLPNELTADAAPTSPRTQPSAAALAFDRVDAFFASGSLTSLLREMEGALVGGDATTAAQVLAASVFDESLVDAALLMRERIGMLDSLVHAAVISHVLPQVLEPGETIRDRPSLGAGNDPERPFDLATSRRVAEFKVSVWKGADSMRQRGLVADVVGLSLDTTGRRREMYVVGDLPRRYLHTSRSDVAMRLSKSALRLRQAPGLTPGITVRDFVREQDIHVIDLREFLPGLGE